jgi:hypothetical protein
MLLDSTPTHTHTPQRKQQSVSLRFLFVGEGQGDVWCVCVCVCVCVCGEGGGGGISHPTDKSPTIENRADQEPSAQVEVNLQQVFCQCNSSLLGWMCCSYAVVVNPKSIDLLKQEEQAEHVDCRPPDDDNDSKKCPSQSDPTVPGGSDVCASVRASMSVML